MAQIFVSIAAILGGLSVAAGAFAAHALKEKISERSLEIFDQAHVIKCTTLWHFC